MVKVYLASAYSIGDPATNVRRQMEAADELITLGYAPYVPLLSHFLHIYSPKAYHVWIALDLEWLPLCDCLLRLGGPKSSGADAEETEARNRGMRVFHSV
ncbi:MAG: DUF4406 domain-containing protein, partial [Alphaproteobacteria bacterium]|nr:DUF4406 domain-containing protein [Alphaproteobacteria bacterium]